MRERRGGTASLVMGLVGAMTILGCSTYLDRRRRQPGPVVPAAPGTSGLPVGPATGDAAVHGRAAPAGDESSAAGRPGPPAPPAVLFLRLLPAVVATLGAGWVMAVGGYLFRVHGWKAGSAVMAPAGPLIALSFALARKALTPQRGWPGSKVRLAVSVAIGMPAHGSRIPWVASLAVGLSTLLAGGAALASGYALAMRDLPGSAAALLLAAAVIASGFTIAFWEERRLLAASSGLVGHPLWVFGRDPVPTRELVAAVRRWRRSGRQR